MQVLLMTVILAGLMAMILRANLSRTASARKTRRQASAQVLIQSCMTRVNDLWTSKSPEAFRRDIEQGIMYCEGTSTDPVCPPADQKMDLTCNLGSYEVVARVVRNTSTDALESIEYEITKGSGYL